MRRTRWIIFWALLAILGGLVGRRLEAREPEDLLVEPEPTPLVIRLGDVVPSAESASAPTPKASGIALAQSRVVEILKMFTEPLALAESCPGSSSAEVFASLLYPGVYTYKYTAIATTPGEYVLPPTKAEEMYSPEVYGRNATGRLTVE